MKSCSSFIREDRFTAKLAGAQGTCLSGPGLIWTFFKKTKRPATSIAVKTNSVNEYLFISAVSKCTSGCLWPSECGQKIEIVRHGFCSIKLRLLIFYFRLNLSLF